MNRLPPLVWMGMVFAFGGIGVFFHSQGGPVPMPAAESSWALVEQVRYEIVQRNLSILPGGKVEKERYPYRVVVERGTDLDQPQRLARYILRVRVAGFENRPKLWAGEGINIGLVDSRPNDMIGDVRMVAFRRHEDPGE